MQAWIRGLPIVGLAETKIAQAANTGAQDGDGGIYKGFRGVSVWLTDFGVTGPDGGKGGKYLFVGPGQQAPEAAGHHVLRSPTFDFGYFYRVPETDPTEAAVLETGFEAYPHVQRDDPRPTRFPTPAPDKQMMLTSPPRGMAYWQRPAQVVDAEPVEERDRFFTAMLRPLGIEKGNPFAPDERQTKLLTEAAVVGEAIAKANSFDERFTGARYRDDAMTFLRSLLLAVFAAIAVSTAVPVAARSAIDKQKVTDTYVHLLGRAIVIRQEHTDLEESGVAYDVIEYNPLGSAGFVNPNLDVAYLEAWIAVDDKTPVQLVVPKIEGRYYDAQILDEWGEVITNIDERNYPTHPDGKFVFVAAGSTVELPADAVRIELNSRKAKMFARVEIKGEPATAVALQKQFERTPLGKPVIEPPVPMAAFGNKALIGVELFDDVDRLLASAHDISPIAAQMQALARDIGREA